MAPSSAFGTASQGSSRGSNLPSGAIADLGEHQPCCCWHARSPPACTTSSSGLLHSGLQISGHPSFSRACPAKATANQPATLCLCLTSPNPCVLQISGCRSLSRNDPDKVNVNQPAIFCSNPSTLAVLQISDHLSFSREDPDEVKVKEIGEILSVGDPGRHRACCSAVL